MISGEQATRTNMDRACSDEDFLAIARIVSRETGISLPTEKKAMVVSRLSKRLNDLRLNSFKEYRKLLEHPSDGENERQKMVPALTTNVTRFMREPHHFDYFEANLLPLFAQHALNGGRVRIWSAGCSTGEEPFSLALCILNQLPEAPKLDFQILATDIDHTVLSSGLEATYPMSALEAIPNGWRRDHVLDLGNGLARLSDSCRSLISFKPLNLIDVWPFRGKFDCIFCRNVAIYFERETQEQLWQRFHAQLSTDGTLVIGHSERLSGPAARTFKLSGITTFTRLETNLID